jgi:hypothetical protein
MAKKYKRPTHESDAMKIFMSDSVASEFLPLLQKYGDFAAAAIAFSVRRSPDFWRNIAIDIVYSRAMLNFFQKLRRECRPIRREWLRRIKSFASRYNDDVAAKPTLYLSNAIAGVKAWSVFTVDYAKELIVDVLDERGRKVERFKLMIEG